MTRAQGLTLIRLAFEERDSFSNFYYGPVQKMIFFMPYYDESSFPATKVLDLAEIPKADFCNRMGEYETLFNSMDLLEFGGFLSDRFGFILDIMETEEGTHSVLHTLAHNRFIRKTLEYRIETWGTYIQLFFGETPIEADQANRLKLRSLKEGPSVSTYDFEYTSDFEKQYLSEYRLLEKPLTDPSIDSSERLFTISREIKASMDIWKKFQELYIQAIKSLAKETTFDNKTKWTTTEDPLTKIVIDKLLQQNIELVELNQSKNKELEELRQSKTGQDVQFDIFSVKGLEKYCSLVKKRPRTPALVKGKCEITIDIKIPSGIPRS